MATLTSRRPFPTRRALITLGVSCVIVITCGRSVAPMEPSTATAPAAGASAVRGCEITVSSAGAPLLADPKSPYFDNLGTALTIDGTATSGYREALAHGSAPDGSVLPDGTTGVYYNNGETGGIWMARLAGTSLVPVSAITVDGVLRPQWMGDVDVTLVNGTVRMFYLNGEGGSRRFCVAESSDGLTFQVIALAIQFAGTEADPTVVRLSDGSWLMAYSRANHTGLGFARSGDGLSFTQFATATYGVVPELTASDDGRTRMYVCTAGNVESFISSDAGASWLREGVVIRNADVGRRIVCDPTFIRSRGVFVFKTTDA